MGNVWKQWNCDALDQDSCFKNCWLLPPSWAWQLILMTDSESCGSLVRKLGSLAPTCALFSIKIPQFYELSQPNMKCYNEIMYSLAQVICFHGWRMTLTSSSNLISNKFYKSILDTGAKRGFSSNMASWIWSVLVCGPNDSQLPIVMFVWSLPPGLANGTLANTTCIRGK